MIRMDRRGTTIGFRLWALIALATGLLAACARSAPAPVEYRPVYGAAPISARQVTPVPPTPEAKPTMLTTAQPGSSLGGGKVRRQEQATVRVAALTRSGSSPLVATAISGPPPPKAKPLPRVGPGSDRGAPAVAAMQPPPRRQALFAWPVSGPVISSFGAKSGGLRNDGINIAAARGTPVRAAEAGVVAYVGNELRGYGNLVLLRHDEGWMTAYAHLQQVEVVSGQRVERGEVVAHVGRSGQVGEPQLHFEIRTGRNAVDPARYLSPKRGTVQDSTVSRAAPPSAQPGPG